MIDLAMDIVSKDLLIKNLDLQLVKDVDYIRQSLEIRLRFFRGEWFLDVNAGTPYYQEILVKNPNLPNIENILKARILETVGVNELTEFSLVISGQREGTLDFKADTIFGPVEFSETIFD